MDANYNPRFPSVESLRAKARKRIPRFAFEYLDGGCNEEVNLRKNTADIRKIELMPEYIDAPSRADLKTELFGHVYDAPFGIAPIGLQGLIWPGSPAILARAASEHNIPFVLSTVTTASIEEISEITGGRAWFQLYHPADDGLRSKIIERVDAAGCPVLVILADTPTFGYRSKEIRNGLAMPPRMTLRNILQIAGKPGWALRTLVNGTPEFKTMKPYTPRGMDMHHLGLFMNKTFDGRLTGDRIKQIRDMWKRKLVIKGLAGEADVERAISWGVDGIILSNHGGRQLDAGPSSIATLQELAPLYGSKIKLMLDSGLRSGPDIARAIASGAAFTFLGRAFMYGAAALGEAGGGHTVSILKRQLRQISEQLGCSAMTDLPSKLRS